MTDPPLPLAAAAASFVSNCYSLQIFRTLSRGVKDELGGQLDTDPKQKLHLREVGFGQAE